jgi:hypothetical protein
MKWISTVYNTQFLRALQEYFVRSSDFLFVWSESSGRALNDCMARHRPLGRWRLVAVRAEAAFSIGAVMMRLPLTRGVEFF